MPDSSEEVPADIGPKYNLFAFSDCPVEIVWIDRSGKALRKQIVVYEPEPVGEVDTPAKQ